MNEDEIKAKIEAALEYCRKLTLQLVRLSADSKDIEQVASGFFIRHDGAVYLVSAGHVLNKNGWTIETTFTIEEECLTACIPIGGQWTFERMTIENEELGESHEMDIAWAKVDLDAFQKRVTENKKLKGKSFEYLIYEGPLENTPNADDPHIYAASNRVEYYSAVGKTYLERKFSYEFDMRYKCENEDGLYVFSVPKHQGDSYYRGASGSPIIEPSGKIVAILVAGCESKNELYGYPSKGLIDLIKIKSCIDMQNTADAS
jgi:hypothetical protein